MGKIFSTQRFSTYDGPGIRTAVFFKGCPLRCAWCHNPESNESRREIFFDPEKCIGCGRCEPVCPNGCHNVTDGVHRYNREVCSSCGACANSCPAEALRLCGEEKTADEVLDVVLRDKDFYERSGGGMTLSGGEPLAQPDFARELLEKAKKKGIHTCVETSGYAPKEALEPLIPLTDLFLFDIKLTDEESHRRYTGVGRERILQNLRRIDEAGGRIVLRLPVIPGVNLTKEHFKKVAELANSLKNVEELDLEAYHPLGIRKAEQLGKRQKYEEREFLNFETLKPYEEELRQATGKTVKIQ